MHRHAWLFLLALCFGAIAAPALADNRVALVIGNGAYAHAPHLPNPSHDAEDVAAALKRTGFQTIVGLDLDQTGMQNAAIRFARAARNADVAVFYYSGHAMQYAGVNYLVPIDAELRDEADLRRMARVDEILSDLQQAKNLRILVLDSCRNNPLADELRRSIGKTRGAGLGRGLAKMESPNGTIISYSTQSGTEALDGDGRNSPYTSAFLKHIEDRDEVSTVFHRISARVYESTNGEQTPELSLSFFGEFYLNGRLQITAAPTAPSAPADPCIAAESHWKSAEAIGTVDAYQDHLARFPNCTFAGLAKARVEGLKTRVAAVTPPAVATVAPDSTPSAAWLGVEIRNVTAEDAASPGVEPKGTLIVGASGPAKLAGLAAGDVIVGFDGKSVREMKELPRLVAVNQPGRNVEIVILRKGNEIRKMVSLGRLDEAHKWYEKDADAGDTSAMLALGRRYANGNGVAQDYAEARRWYEKAAAANDPRGMMSVGRLYANGQGVAQDYAEARKWYEKAAIANEPYAMINLGILYENGQGVSLDYAEARKWYEKAAAANELQAMINLGRLYENGKGVAKDYTEARKWYEKAAATGKPGASDALKAFNDRTAQNAPKPEIDRPGKRAN